MKHLPIYRVWHKKLKRMGWAIELSYGNVPLELTDITVKFDNDGQKWHQETFDLRMTNDLVIMAETGLTDDDKKPIFEEDVLECIFPHPVYTTLEKTRGRVVWNAHLSYGEYGFVMIDEFGGIHPFKTLDTIKIIGNSFQGIAQTT